MQDYQNYALEIFFTLLALGVVVAIAWIILKAIKGVHTHRNKQNPLQVQLTLPLGSRERILIIHYENHEYMLGVTANNISLLDKKALSDDNSLTDEQ